MRARLPKPKSASRYERKPRDNSKRERVNKPGQGRPQSYFPTPADRDNVRNLAAILAPYDEIANFLDISRDTLLRHYRAELDKGRSMGLLNGRRTIMSLVRGAPAEYDENGNTLREEVKPDPATVRFFARTKLGYVEEYKVKTSQTVEPTAFDWSKLDDEELAAAERIFAKAIDASGGNAIPGANGNPQQAATTRH